NGSCIGKCKGNGGRRLSVVERGRSLFLFFAGIHLSLFLPRLNFKPLFMAYNLLKGKRGIITGALDANSIAWKVAEKAHEEGATFVLTNAPIAMRMGEIKKLAESTGSEIIPADAT